MSLPAWWIYRGQGSTHPEWVLPDPPPWRDFAGTEPAPVDGDEPVTAWPARDDEGVRRLTHVAGSYRADATEARMINAALHLRRPLLVTGNPGTGKSTLAYSVAYELGLKPVLYWPINSKTTLTDGLYRYDAIARLQDAGLRDRPADAADARPAPPIGRYLGLGPLGTALLPADRPRVLLVDELDKGDIDLPNDLLSVFEEGQFSIPELQRLDREVVTVKTDDGETARIRRGVVRCSTFPLVVITSNGERDFPPAFIRRCLRLHIPPPSEDKLKRIVAAQLGEKILADAWVRDTIAGFAERLTKPETVLATDQLLNALRLRMGSADDDDIQMVVDNLLTPLNEQA